MNIETGNDSFPDWEFIDEISIHLLEQGVGTYDVLQRALPSIVLARINKIEKDCSEERLLKLFRVAQMQIQYILQTQQDLVEKLRHEQAKAKKFSKECHIFRKNLTKANSLTINKLDGKETEENNVKRLNNNLQNELFKCNECSKIFLHSSFLCEHIQRRHGTASAISNTSAIEHFQNSHGKKSGGSKSGAANSPLSSSTNTSVWK